MQGALQMLIFFPYEYYIRKNQRLSSDPESSVIKTAQLKQALAQLEANLSREELQQITEISKKTK